jgi:DNA-binding LacI/PurR family transcriptional regulator
MNVAAPIPPAKVTLKFLSQLLGLSKTTISIVLNDSPHAQTISPKTRERVLNAAREHNYRPNFMGRSLNDGRSYLIGVISPDLSEGYTSSLLAGIEQALLESDYQFFIASHHWSETRINKIARLFQDRGVEGIILVNSPFMPTIDLPSLSIGRHDGTIPGTSLIVDNHCGILAAMRHLVELGHSNIAFIRGHRGSVDSTDRWNAVLAAAQQLSVRVQESLVVELERLGVFSHSALDEGAQCADKLIQSRGAFTALLAFNDMSAIGAVNRFRAAGWSIPQELSVVGFDDVVESQILYPALTTVRQPLREMGERAALELIRSITQDAPRETILFKPELLVRGSTGQAPACTKHL